MKNQFFRDPITGRVLPERRSGIDRRGPSAFIDLFTSPYRRRRSKGRRKTDAGAYVDIYDSRTWGIAVAVVLMSFLDAVLTGLHVTRGSAKELNPFMDAVIREGGISAFFGVKAAMTVFPMALILIHKEWALGKFAARLCLWAYALLTLYHLYLLYMSSRLF